MVSLIINMTAARRQTRIRMTTTTAKAETIA